MFKLGEKQKLKVSRFASVGAYLVDFENEKGDEILLPKNQVKPDISVGDIIEVFIYKDSEDRLIATRKKPKVTLGELGYLKVVETTRIGAFLDWGLEKDLFLPFKEQTCKVEKGSQYLVTLY